MYSDSTSSVSREDSAAHGGDCVVTADERLSEVKIYEETAKVAAIFWEWRHKTMTRFFAVVGGIIAAVYWLLPSGTQRWYCIPLLLGATYSYISYRLDKRHSQIFLECYRIAAEIERKARQEGAIYNFIEKLHYEGRGSLTQILQTLYLTSALILAVSAVIVLVLASQ